MIKKRLVGNTAIIVVDNTTYHLNNVKKDLWDKICIEADKINKNQTTDLSLFYDLINPNKVQKDKLKLILKEKRLKELKSKENAEKMAEKITDVTGLFEYDKDGLIYLKGVDYPIPKLLAEAVLEALYSEKSRYTVSSLVNFWKWLLLNPDKHVREGLFDWIYNSNFAITEEGNIIAYRNVDIKLNSPTKKLEKFVLQSWIKIKKQKKSPKNYIVNCESSKYKLKCIKDSPEYHSYDTLHDLYVYYTNEHNEITEYTDNYSHTMTIKIGTPVKMDRESCDNNPNKSCSSGLHGKSISYGGGFGDNTLVMLVNPYNVVAIPKAENTKFRCCEYLPIAEAVVDKQGNIIGFSAGTYDIKYKCLESLVKELNFDNIDQLQQKNLLSNCINSISITKIINDANKILKTK